MASTLKPARRSRWDNGVPFRFMDLPFDLRLMVYEYLPIVRRHVNITVPSRNTDASQPKDGYFILVVNSIPPLHVTCRAIYEESRKIISDTRNKLLHDVKPPKMIIGFDILADIDNDRNPLNEILDWCYYMTESAEMALKVNGRANLINALSATDLERAMALRGHSWASKLSPEDIVAMTTWIRHTGWWLTSQRRSEPNLPHWHGAPIANLYVFRSQLVDAGWLPDVELNIGIQMQPSHILEDAGNESECSSSLRPAVERLHMQFMKRGLPSKILLRLTGTSAKMREAWAATREDLPDGHERDAKLFILPKEWEQHWAVEDGFGVGSVASDSHARRRSG